MSGKRLRQRPKIRNKRATTPYPYKKRVALSNCARRDCRSSESHNLHEHIFSAVVYVGTTLRSMGRATQLNQCQLSHSQRLFSLSGTLCYPPLLCIRRVRRLHCVSAVAVSALIVRSFTRGSVVVKGVCSGMGVGWRRGNDHNGHDRMRN